MHLVNMIASVLFSSFNFPLHFLAFEVFYLPIVFINAESNFPKRKKREFSILFLTDYAMHFFCDENNYAQVMFFLVTYYQDNGCNSINIA